jgi:hypothetical protein
VTYRSAFDPSEDRERSATVHNASRLGIERIVPVQHEQIIPHQKGRRGRQKPTSEVETDIVGRE